jgi:hypothetical protein
MEAVTNTLDLPDDQSLDCSPCSCAGAASACEECGIPITINFSNSKNELAVHPGDKGDIRSEIQFGGTCAWRRQGEDRQPKNAVVITSGGRTLLLGLDTARGGW